jgi:superfamily II DNA or RNA helicase
MTNATTSLPHPLQWYPHQIDAINQCIDVERSNGSAAALDMPMGFGKTLVLLTLAMVMQPGLTIWLCEKTHMSTVVADVVKFFPNAYIGTVASVNDVALPPCHDKCRGIVVMSYTSFERVIIAHPKGAWMMLRRILDLLPIVRVVCDEAQRIPTIGLRRELIDALQITTWHVGAGAGCAMGMTVRPDVSALTSELPSVVIQHVRAEFSPAEQHEHNRLFAALRDISRIENIKIRAALLRLSMHPPLHLAEQGVVSAKVLMLERLLAQAVAPGEKLVVFCRMQCMLDAIRARIAHSVVFIDGDTSSQNRADAIEAFGTHVSMLVMTHVGTVGLNLTSARTVVFMDAISVNDPAFDAGVARVRRIGQMAREVRVFIITAGVESSESAESSEASEASEMTSCV